MKILLTIMLFLPLLVQASDEGKSPTVLYIKKVIGADETISKVEIPEKEIFVDTKAVWRSNNGIECASMLVANEKQTLLGTFECKATEGYKAQITFDCSKNYSEETSAYLFFGLEGARGNNGNFYVWCE